jgi:hypothetical protein
MQAASWPSHHIRVDSVLATAASTLHPSSRHLVISSSWNTSHLALLSQASFCHATHVAGGTQKKPPVDANHGQVAGTARGGAARSAYNRIRTSIILNVILLAPSHSHLDGNFNEPARPHNDHNPPALITKNPYSPRINDWKRATSATPRTQHEDAANTHTHTPRLSLTS